MGFSATLSAKEMQFENDCWKKTFNVSKTICKPKSFLFFFIHFIIR